MGRSRLPPTSLAPADSVDSPAAGQLGQLIGEGGSAWVYRTSDGIAVVKLAKPDHAETLVSEAQRALFLRSAALPELLEVGELTRSALPKEAQSSPGLYSVWHYLPGADADGLALDEHSLLYLLRDVARGLTELHRLGLAHGDIKPANVRYDSAQRRGWLLDLGMVAPLSTHVPIGATPRYLDPSLSEGRPSDARARDLYALGLTLLELLVPDARGWTTPSDHLEQLPDTPLGVLIENLLAPESQRRPPACWLWSEASRLLGESDPALAPYPILAESSYIWVRRKELLWAAQGTPRLELEGPPRRWVERSLSLLGPLARLGSHEKAKSERCIKPLSPTELRAWMVQLIGAEAASFAPLRLSEAELAQRVAAHCERFPATLLTERELADSLSPTPLPRSLQVLALGLGQEPSLGYLLAGVDLVRRGDADVELRCALARALRRRSEFASALDLLNQRSELSCRAEYSETLRRMGARQAAITSAQAALESLSSLEALPNEEAWVGDRLRGTLARALMETGDLKTAAEALRGDSPAISTLEARVLLGMAQDSPVSAIETDLELVESHARGDEERARALGLRGYFEHRRGRVGEARVAFEGAVQHASRAGARAEEATYLTGLAATASDAGHLGQAISAAERASLIFGHLQELSRAARAQLNLGSALLAAGAYAPAGAAFAKAADLAGRSADEPCQHAAALSELELAVYRADFSEANLALLGVTLEQTVELFKAPSP
ncbi:MAG: hypothetical protein KC492_28510, partial [Myxococcales bacterium]|nr:hypothetical protein [Myxococcales bacterium]